MSKKMITWVVVALAIVVIVSAVTFFLLRDNMFIPFESDKLTSITDIREYKKLDKDNITKIEISYGGELLKTLTDKSDIKELIEVVNNVSGYKISAEKAVLGSLYAIQFYEGDNISLIISMSHRDFRIIKSNDIKYYKLEKDYLEQILSLLKLENAEG